MSDRPDVVVVGAGLVGLCCARAIAARGRSVLVLDAARAGGGASAGNTGWIVPSLSTPLAAPGMLRQGLRAAFDPGGALVIRPSLDADWIRWLWQFRRSCAPQRYRDGVRTLVELNRRTLDAFDALADDGVIFDVHEGGMLLVARERGGLEWFAGMHRELVALGHGGALERLTPDEARSLEPSLSPTIREAMRTAVDRYVRPEQLAAGLATWLRARGVEIREEVRAERIEPTADGARVVLAIGPIETGAVVIATGADAPRLVAPLGTRLPITGAKGYSITLRGTGAAPGQALYLSDAKLGISPYGDELRIAGVFELPGRDRRVDPARVRALVTGATAYLADWQPEPFDPTTGWAGLRPATPDGLPVIGPLRDHPRVFVAAGHGMLGVTLAPATGELIAGLVAGDPLSARSRSSER